MRCWKRRCRKRSDLSYASSHEGRFLVCWLQAHHGKRGIMRRDIRLGFSLVLVLTVAGMAFAQLSLGPGGAVAAAPSAQPGAADNAASKETCLGCHGPFDKLTGSANYQAPSGERISPHRYVPHSAREAKAVPECSNCHEPHPVPPTTSSPSALPKPEVQWCYTACHHKNTFQLCKDCHK